MIVRGAKRSLFVRGKKAHRFYDNDARKTSRHHAELPFDWILSDAMRRAKRKCEVIHSAVELMHTARASACYPRARTKRSGGICGSTPHLDGHIHADRRIGSNPCQYWRVAA